MVTDYFDYDLKGNFIKKKHACRASIHVVLIIQDEHPAVQRLKRLLNDLNPHTEVLDIPGSVEDVINWFRNNPAPDIVFMDIQLEDGICFEILRKLKSEPTSFSPPRLTNMPLMRSKRTVWITC